MYLFKINSDQFAISYFFPGIFQRKSGFVPLFESQSTLRVLSIFLLIDCIFIGLLFYSVNGIDKISIASVLLLQFLSFFIKNYLLSKSRIRIPVHNLDNYTVAPIFYWITHFFMAFPIIYALYELAENPHILSEYPSLGLILNILQFIFWIILISPLINLIMTKIKSLTK